MIKRPPIRYHGGKWRLAPWVIKQMPEHRTYVEPFCGACGVLLRKPRAEVEIANDKYDRIVNLLRVFRDPEMSEKLATKLALTPYSETEYRDAREVSADPVEDARRMIVLGHCGHGSTAASGGKLSGFRRGDSQDSRNCAAEFGSLHELIPMWANRIRGVLIECQDAKEVIARWDSPQTLHYVDPPYVQDTRRTAQAGYEYEMQDEQHVELIELLRSVKGRVIISGYASGLYAELLEDWRIETTEHQGDQGITHNECLWFSPNCPEIEPELF